MTWCAVARQQSAACCDVYEGACSAACCGGVMSGELWATRSGVWQPRALATLTSPFTVDPHT